MSSVARRVAGREVRWTRADCYVISTRTETFQIVGIKTMCDSKAEDSRCNELMSSRNGTLNARWGFVSIWGCIGDMREMVWGVIVHKDSFPHHLFGWGVVIEDSGVPIVRSLGYLHLTSASLLCLFPKFRPSGGAQPLLLKSNEIYRGIIVIGKVGQQKTMYVISHMWVSMGFKH
jgi:hypothetical protein